MSTEIIIITKMEAITCQGEIDTIVVDTMKKGGYYKQYHRQLYLSIVATSTFHGTAMKVAILDQSTNIHLRAFLQ